MKKNYKKEKYSTHEEWLKHRGIGGSDASAIVNKSKWSTKNDVYNRLVLGKEKHIKSNERMEQGKATESVVRDLFSIIHNDYKVINPPKKGGWIFRRTDYPLITCTPDGLLKRNKKLGVYEGKNVQLFKNEDKDMWNSNTLPDQYYYQALNYFVTMNDVDFVLVHPLLQFMKYENGDWVLDHIEIKEMWIYREDVIDHIKYLEDNEIDFIKNNVQCQKRPEQIINLGGLI